MEQPRHEVRVLHPAAVFGAHGDVLQRRLLAGVAAWRERLWIATLEGPVNQPALVRDHPLQQARLDPLAVAARVAHAQRREDAARRRLARGPTCGLHRYV